MNLKEKECLFYLLISHDISVAQYISDRLGVMYLAYLFEESAHGRTFPQSSASFAAVSSQRLRFPHQMSLCK